MIRKLRRKFIAAAMISVVLVLSVIIGIINILNYRSVINNADDTLALLQYFDGAFPQRDGRQEMNGFGSFMQMDIMSPELPYQSRFFTVRISETGYILSVNIDQIAAVNAEEAVEMAVDVAKKEKSTGFVGVYRYLCSVDSTELQVIFLDCAKELDTCETFLLVSVGTSVVGILAVWVMLILLSGRIFRPVSESYEKQKQFITDAGHEIKTPITIIDADAELLEMDMSENEWLQDIRTQTKRLSDLTNELIYLSRMDEEQNRLSSIEFPLSDMVGETAASFQALAITQNKTFTANVEPMLSVNGDEKSLRQLVSILLDNALKYSPEGGYIDLDLRKNGKNVILTVSNTTSGLEKGDLSRLFDRFYRTDQSRSSSTGGYGLGLAIAQAVVNSHRGKITATSPDGLRMILEVQLPI